MAVTSSDMKFYGPLLLPSNDTNSIGGGINTSDEITGATIGELFTKRAANTAGGADKVSYTKEFLMNTHATDSLYSAKIWIDNALLAVSVDGIAEIASTSASDDDSHYIKLKYKNAGGSHVTENVVLNGTTVVYGTGSIAAGEYLSAELYVMSGAIPADGDALDTAVGDISITRGSLLGKIPEGYRTAHTGYALWLAATLDDTATASNRLTAPAGSSFSVVNTEASALSCADDIDAGEAQGIWIRQTIVDGQLSVSDMDICIRYTGEDA